MFIEKVTLSSQSPKLRLDRYSRERMLKIIFTLMFNCGCTVFIVPDETPAEKELIKLLEGLKSNFKEIEIVRDYDEKRNLSYRQIHREYNNYPLQVDLSIVKYESVNFEIK